MYNLRLIMKDFNISHFCDNYNKDFKIYYNYFKNPIYTSIIHNYLLQLKTDHMKTFIKDLIKKHKKYIKQKLTITNYIIDFYTQNKLIEKTNIGKFFLYYKKSIKNKNLNNDTDLFNLFYQLLEYDNLINFLKECFYIFSDYRSCLYFTTPNINFNIPSPSKKILLKNIVTKFNDNLYSLMQIISKIYIGDKNPLGSPYYSIIYGTYESLLILKKYFKNPLKECDISFKTLKICNKNNIIKNLCISYHSQKMKNNKLDIRINENNINTVSQFIIILKRLGYDLWYVIPLVFNTIFTKYTLKYKGHNNLNIDAPILNHSKLYYQKKNIEIGVKIFILIQENYITNINILQNFND